MWEIEPIRQLPGDLALDFWSRSKVVKSHRGDLNPGVDPLSWIPDPFRRKIVELHRKVIR